MAAIRLNEGHRKFLHTLVEGTIKCPVEEKADKIAYDKARPLVRKAVEEKYPPKEMKLLRKYEVAMPDRCVKLQLTAGGVVQFSFRDDDAPLVPDLYACRARIYPTDNQMTAAVNASLEAKAALEKAMSKKRDDYRALINASVTLEQVEAIWPASSALRERVGRSLPVVLSNDVIARIKADVSSMARAA